MKKLLFLFLAICSTFCYGQRNLDISNYSYYSYGVTQGDGIPTVYLDVDKLTKYISPFNFTLNGDADNMVLLNGTRNIKLHLRIPKDSIKFYRYSLLQDDSITLKEDVPLNYISYEWSERSDYPRHVDVSLGNLNIINKKILLELYKLPNKFKRTSVIFYNKTIPALKLKKLIYGSVKDKRGRLDTLASHSKIKVKEALMNQGLLLIHHSHADLKFLYKVKIEDRDGQEVFSRPLSRFRGDSILLRFDWLKKSGRYKIQVSPDFSIINTKTQVGQQFVFDGTKSNTYQIEIQLEKELTAKELIYILILCVGLTLLIGITVIAIIRRNNRKKIKLANQQKEISRTRLDSIRSQLNPHFMFNALAGIQSLINQNKTEEANQYLNRFSRLTRNVLDKKELISLAEERDLLEDYLKMEQSRFGFQYLIQMGDAVDLNVEIPSMLLQPLVENAVKHGISSKGSDGEIKIDFERENQSLVITVRDNGNGFDAHKTYEGLGLQLSKDRINLLNSIYPETKFELHISSSDSGAEIKIIIVDWL